VVGHYLAATGITGNRDRRCRDIIRYTAAWGSKKRAEMLKVDGGRLWSDLMTMGAIGATERGGSSRAALSDADRDARNLFVYWAKEAGLAITIDKLGNLFARREGADPAQHAIKLASWRLCVEMAPDHHRRQTGAAA
jgi:hypothetical protein